MKIKIVLFLALILILFMYSQNNSIKISEYVIKSDKLPENFNHFKILQLSDLHNKVFGKDNKVLISDIKKLKPDLIVITGDLIDFNRLNEKVALSLIDEIVPVSPIYYVTGNHEMTIDDLSGMEEALRQKGVKILRNSSDIISRQGDRIMLSGIDDPVETQMQFKDCARETLREEIDSADKDKVGSDFNILLTHRPEHFSLYAEYNFDLIFAGHAHGGQVRLPFLGGLYVPSQGFFPKYTSGVYKSCGSSMVVSRGLGNGSMPQRIFNWPEIVVVTLLKQ